MKHSHLTDPPLPYELSGELDTIGPCDFSGTLPGGFAAHTKLDHATGELHAIAYFWAWDHVQHVIIGAGGTVSRTTDIAVADGPMMHDFALTPSATRDVLYGMAVIMAVAALVALRGLRRGVQEDTVQTAKEFSSQLPGEDPGADLDPAWR